MDKNEIEFNPRKNNKAISIMQDEDGNWSGYIFKFDKLITVRGIGPETVLQLLLTNNGK